jgi:hypothetical protein
VSVNQIFMQKTITTLALASLLSVSGSWFWANGSFARPDSNETIMVQNQDDSLPNQVAMRVRKALSEQTGISPEELQIVEASERTWSDSCLGLGRANELCAQVIVEGYRVVLSDSNQTWAYRTDEDGSNLRLEGDTTAIGELPGSVRREVLETAARVSGLSTDALEVMSATQKVWSNGCLELARPDELCTQALVEGWRVTVDAGERKLVFHTNAMGSQVRLNESASQISQDTNLIPVSELPPPLPQNVVLRTISSGGIIGRNYEVFLTEDGQLHRRLLNRRGEVVMQHKFQLPAESVQEFQSFLQNQDLSSFHRLDFPAPSGSGDGIRVLLTTDAGTVRYVDFQQSQLPEMLQAVVKRWEALVKMA